MIEVLRDFAQPPLCREKALVGTGCPVLGYEGFGAEYRFGGALQ